MHSACLAQRKAAGSVSLSFSPSHSVLQLLPRPPSPDTLTPCPSVCSRIQSNVEGLYLIDGVPFSCCNPHSPRPCLQDQLSDPHAHPLFDPRQPNLNLWPQGCHGVLLGHLQGLASTLGSMLAVTFLLQVSPQCLRPPSAWTASLPPTLGPCTAGPHPPPPLASPDCGAPGPAVPADGAGGAWRSHRWGRGCPGLSPSRGAEAQAEDGLAAGRGCPQASTGGGPSRRGTAHRGPT